VRYPNVYGIDMPAAHELIAHGRTEQEVCEAIGADKLIYQEIGDLIDAVNTGNHNISHFDTSCFTHEYITGDIDDAYLARIEALRNDGAQEQRKVDTDLIEAQSA
jgi:amidophosphoribosyltransferase